MKLKGWMAAWLFLISQAACATQPYFLSQAILAAALAAQLKALEAFSSIPCLTPQAKKHIGKLKKGVADGQIATTLESKFYMNFVAKPMEGDGKCDGGFQSVALESEKRLARTDQFKDMLDLISGAMNENTADNLVNADIGIDGTEDEACADKALDAYDDLENLAAATDNAYTAAQASLDFEKSRFQEFRDANLELAKNCGNFDPVKYGNQVASIIGSPGKAHGAKGATLRKSKLTGNFRSSKISQSAKESMPTAAKIPVPVSDSAVGAVGQTTNISPARLASQYNESQPAPADRKAKAENIMADSKYAGATIASNKPIQDNAGIVARSDTAPDSLPGINTEIPAQKIVLSSNELNSALSDFFSSGKKSRTTNSEREPASSGGLEFPEVAPREQGSAQLQFASEETSLFELTHSRLNAVQLRNWSTP